MLTQKRELTDAEIASLLRERGVAPTPQRSLVVRALFGRGDHLSAEELFRLVNASEPQVSKATVYNTLGLLVSKGLIRAVIADPDRVLYDPNTTPHHHFYDEATGELTDIDSIDVQVNKLPPLPAGTELQGIDVIVRVRRADVRADKERAV